MALAVTDACSQPSRSTPPGRSTTIRRTLPPRPPPFHCTSTSSTPVRVSAGRSSSVMAVTSGPFMPAGHGRSGGARRPGSHFAGSMSRDLLGTRLLPGHQKSRRVEDRAVSAGDDADEEGEDEPLDRRSAEEDERQQDEDDGERRV